MKTVPAGTTHLFLKSSWRGYSQRPDYRTLPKSVVDLTIDDRFFSPSKNPLPPRLQTLTLINASKLIDTWAPTSITSLTLFEYTGHRLCGLPASLQRLCLSSCKSLSLVWGLKPFMDRIEIDACPGLARFDFLPADRVEKLVVSNMEAKVTLNYTVREIGRLTIKNCRKVGDMSGIKRITGYLHLKDLKACNLSVLPVGLENLWLSNFSLEGEQGLPPLKRLTLSSCRYSMGQLPRSLESLVIRGSSGSNGLMRMPEYLKSLELIDLEDLKSYEGMPLNLLHITVQNVPQPTDFPPLFRLRTAEIDMVRSDGKVYTSGEQYLARF